MIWKDELKATSYARALDQASFLAAKGYTPSDCIRAVGFNWQGKGFPNWDDAVYVLAYSYRRLPKPRRLPLRAFEAIAPEPKPPEPKLRKCLKCGDQFESLGLRICPTCSNLARQYAGSIAEGL